MRLVDYAEYRAYLQHPGLYEIGLIRDDLFYPKYLGKASSSIYDRIYRHATGRGNTNIAERLVTAEVKRGMPHLWFHVIFTDRLVPDASEAALLARFRIGADGLYLFNQRYE